MSAGRAVEAVQLDYRAVKGLDGAVEPVALAPVLRGVSPIRDNIYIQPLRVTESAGGIHFPATFKAGKGGGFSARERINAVQDLYRARVLAVGPDTTLLRDSDQRPVQAGDEILVWAFNGNGDDSKLWTGIEAGGGKFIKPDDIVARIEL